VRTANLCLLAFLIGAGYSQPPTAFFGVRLLTQVRADSETTRWLWYNDLAQHATVSLQVYHDSGYGAYIAQRLQNIRGDRTRTALDEFYVERVGGWRVGKFYAPFGAGTLLNESVVAAQSPTRFAIGDLPMRVAYVFNGKDRQQGVLVRVGTQNGGVSVGVGRHFGTDPHAFALWQLPEEPRAPQGYETLYGADWRPPILERTLLLEWVYTESDSLPDTHWLSLRWEPVGSRWRPDLRLAYQSHANTFSWRVALQQTFAERFRAALVFRGNQGTLQFVAIELRGEL